MRVVVCGVVFIGAFKSTMQPLSDKKLFTIDAGSEYLRRSVDWLLGTVFTYDEHGDMLNDLWTIMYENDEAGLIMWKLTHAHV